MKHLLINFILFFTIFRADSYGQIFAANSCDSTILTKEEFEKCMGDRAWNEDFVITTNYISNFKTYLLPKYRNLRKELKLSNELQNLLRHLKAIYDTTLNTKLLIIIDEMDKNQKYVQPKAYLSSLLSLQTFKLYPDVYAILLNNIHLQLSPKTSISNLKVYTELVDKIFNAIPPELLQHIEPITTSFLAENDKLKKSGFSPLFQGTQSKEDKRKYQIINFLLWTE